MKTLNKISMQLFYALTIFISVAFSSCSEKEEVVTPQFPELKEITGKVGDVLDVTFSANLDWTIKSDASWCKFVNGEFKEVTANGKAGEQTLKIELSDESWNPSTADVAQLTLSMNNQSQVIYKVTRSAKELQNLVVTNEDGTVTYDAEHPLTIKGSGLRDVPSDIVYTIIKATADVNVGVIEKPNWLSVTNEGNGVFKLIFDKGNSEGISPINSFGVDKGYKLVVATEDYNSVETDKVRKVEIPLSYEGLKDDYVTISPLYELPLLISKLGDKVSIDNNENELVYDFNSEDNLSVKVSNVRNNDYRVLVFSKTEQELPNGGTKSVYDFEEPVDWLVCTKTESGFEMEQPSPLTVNGERGAIVMVFSEDFCKKNEHDWSSVLLDEDGYIELEYNKNIFASFTQKDPSIKLKGTFKFNDKFYNFGPYDDEDIDKIDVDDENLKLCIVQSLCEEQYGESIISFENYLLKKGEVFIELINYKSDIQIQYPTIEGIKFELSELQNKYYIKITGQLINDMTEPVYLNIVNGMDIKSVMIAINNQIK